MAGPSVKYSKIDYPLEQLTNSHVIPERKVLCQCFNGNGVGVCGELMAQALQKNRLF